MTTIPGTDMTTEDARNLAARHGGTGKLTTSLLATLADAYDDLSASFANAVHVNIDEFVTAAIAQAKSVADRDTYSPQESAAAWDVVDALVKLQTTSEHVTPEPDQDDRDGKQITRAEEWVTEGLDDRG